jgi:beta-N-acetylhexosaminidase
MGGVTRRFSQAESVLLGIEAGADLLLQPPDAAAAVNAVVAAVESKRIPESRIDASVRRILAAKERAGVVERPLVDVAEMARVVGAPEHLRLAREVARRSITLVRDERGVVPLQGAAHTILSITYTDGNRPSAGRAFDAALRAAGHRVTSERVGEGTGAAAYAALRRRAATADLVVVSGYVSPREYRGTVQTSAAFTELVQGMSGDGRPVVGISFGSPYLLSSFPRVPAYVAAWGGSALSQSAAADALLGRAPITGRMPVTIPQLHPRGAGITRAAAVRAGQP